ncbi:MAG: ABC transporter ATP-binding protein [Solirubrobacteraceae bacterium]|nr:ABC transporter ATP-binding protein [Solirubrobacteraceae bacterium]
MAELSVEMAVTLRDFELSVSLDVGSETIALVGPSGAGKTTVLRAVAGLFRPDRARIRLDEDEWTSLPPEARSVGYVFQDYALFPHLSVRKNVAFGGSARVDELLERFGIAGLADAKPGAISGGERQRVALARALARDPSVLLLDEPLSALDTDTRLRVRSELHDLLGELALPTVMVTHDFRDALALADRIGVLVRGTLRQVGTPAELMAAPADAFVVTFTGGYVADGVGVYPWDASVSSSPPESDRGLHIVAGPAQEVVFEGGRTRVRVGGLVGETSDAIARGDQAWLVVPTDRTHRLPDVTSVPL